MDVIIRRVRDDFPGPKVFSFDFESSSVTSKMVKENIETMLAFATDLDVILLSNHSQRQLFEWSPVNSTGFLTELKSFMRRLKPDWQMYRCAERVVLKSTQLIAPPPLHVPQLPVCQRPEVLPPIVVDVVFVSRNRPMQVPEELASFSAVVVT